MGNGEFSLDYDYLVIAIGAQVNTFNTPGVLENCHFLKVLPFCFFFFFFGMELSNARYNYIYAINLVDYFLSLENLTSYAGSRGCSEDS